jgi:hypothetical protein
MMVNKNTNETSPLLKVTLYDFLFDTLCKEAKDNICSVQDEFVDRLVATFNNDIEYRVRAIELKQSNITISSANTHSQVISQDLMDVLIESAIVDQHTIDQEISLRLMVSFVNAPEMALTQKHAKAIAKNITHTAKEAERFASIGTTNTMKKRG